MQKIITDKKRQSDRHYCYQGHRSGQKVCVCGGGRVPKSQVSVRFR